MSFRKKKNTESLTLTDKYIEILEYADQHEEFSYNDLRRAVSISESFDATLFRQIVDSNLTRFLFCNNFFNDCTSY